jgi:Ser-tRNA(Ala) deacylase AlaX
MSTYMLDIEKDIALPANAAEAMPPMTQQEELEVRARTIKLISDLQGKALEPNEDDKTQARELAKKMLNDRENVDFSNYRNETLAYLAGMVSMYDQMLVKDLADYKLYVVNKLVEQSANPDPKYALPAIKALGEVDGVDAFKKRSEVTVQHKSAEEVEKSLMEKLEKLERLTSKQKKIEVVDVEDVDVNPTEN